MAPEEQKQGLVRVFKDMLMNGLDSYKGLETKGEILVQF